MRQIKPKNNNTLSEEREPDYPKFSISLDYLPEAKEWKIGKEYKVTLKLEMTEITIGNAYRDDKGNVRFDVKGVEVNKKLFKGR